MCRIRIKKIWDEKRKLVLRGVNVPRAVENNENDQQLQKKNLCIEYLLLQRFSQMIYIKFNKVKQKIILKNNNRRRLFFIFLWIFFFSKILNCVTENENSNSVVPLEVVLFTICTISFQHFHQSFPDEFIIN